MSEAIPTSAGGDTPERTAALARGFLSALFMGLRTAQVHDPQNAAFQNAIETVRRAAEDLYSATGPFTFQMVEGSTFINGARLRFDGNLFQTMKKLRELLESRGMGGLAMKAPPSDATVRKLVLLFAPEAHQREKISPEELESADVALLGVQRFAETRPNLAVDRRIFAVQTYAKLLLALREQKERLRMNEGRTGGGASPRLRAVRLVQDLVELAQDRVDFLTKLSMNRSGASPELLLGANSTLLSVALGQAAGFRRQDLVSLGVAALFHDVEGAWNEGERTVAAPESPVLGITSAIGFARVPNPTSEAELRNAFGRMLASGDLGASGLLRSTIVGEQARLSSEQFAWGSPRPWPHPLSRVLGAALIFSGLNLGVGPELAGPLHPLDALLAMTFDASGRLDVNLVDLLVNLLRAFPMGSEVLLDSGRRGWVQSYTDRWDRPVVLEALESGPGSSIDLSAQIDGRFEDRIKATLRSVGEPALPEDTLPPIDAAPRRGLSAPELPRPSLLPDPVTPSAAEPSVSVVDETTLLDSTIIPPLDTAFEPEPLTADLLPPASEEDTPVPRVFFVPDDDTEEHTRELTPPPEFEAWTERVEEPVSELDFGTGTGPTTEVGPLPVSFADPTTDTGDSVRSLLGYELHTEIEHRDHRRSYAGLDPRDGADVLVHALMLSELPSNEMTRERDLALFEREGRLATRLSHPGLPRLRQSHEDRDSRVLVYERPVGTKLRYRLLAGQNFETSQLRRIVRGVADALHYLHERGAVYGALGPETLLCTEDGDVCLGDLSFAAPMDEPPHPRLFEQAYLLSPEFRSGGRLGPKSDQYALGGLLYELLTRRYPGSALEQGPGRLRSPEQVQPGADPVLSLIAMRLLDPLPGARFESCETLAIHLTRGFRGDSDV